jgi:Chitobiase/beta-hexosaminidase C-terminal domain
MAIAIAVGVASSQATITPASLSLSTSSSSAVVSGSTLYYSNSGGTFTVTVNDTTDAPPLTIDFPSVFGDNPAAGTALFHTYTWTSDTSDSGSKTVSLSDFGGATKSHSFTVTPDTPIVSNNSPTEVTGAGDQYWNSATNTLWFRPAAAGSFTLNATATDSVKAIDTVDFPDLSDLSGWAGSTGGTDSEAAYASPAVYSWTAAAVAPGAKQVTATNIVGLTATTRVTITADSTAPSGQTVDLSGGPWYTSTSVPLTLGSGTDPGAGVDASRGIVERATAPLANSTCGTFGTFAAVPLSSGADTSVTSGNCYRYQYKATDNVGNVSGASKASADAKVDTTAPTTPNLLFSAFTNTAAAGNVVYYRPGGSGHFTVTAASADGESGVTSYNFPSITGFTMAGSGPTRVYSFAAGPAAAPPAVTVTATNGAGATSAGASFTFVPDATPPTVSVRCNGKPCLTTTYPKAVTVAMSAADGAGSGVDTIRYTTNGTDPTLDRGIEYTRTFGVQTLAHLRVRAYDKAGNASNAVDVTIRSAATRLVFTPPAHLVVKSGARYLFARVASTRRGVVSAILTGPGLKTPQRWRFVLGSGTSIVQLRLPAGLARKGRYKLVWTVRAGTQKASKTTLLAVR